MSDGIILEGLDGVLANLSRLGIGIGEASAGPLYREAERIMQDSKQNYVPVDTGTLRNSGHVTLPVIDKVDGSASVEMGFGGPAESYATIVHENMLANHAVGQYKYLEKPFQEASRTMGPRLAADIEKEVEALIK